MNVPTGYTALDMVGFTDKGTYNSATAYVKNDIAHYGGNLWRCLVDDTTGVTPAEGVNWTVFLAEPTSAAEDIIAQVETSSTAAHSYAVGKQLIYNDTLYTVTSAITVGDTLTVGTNITASDSIVDQLDTKANSSDLATVATTGAYSDLSGKPTLGTAAEKNVPASGDASSSEVVMGDDSRLTNARNAADVSAWAKAANKPTYNGSEIETSTAKTGTAQLSISDTVASGTSMDNVVGTMLNNDKTLDTNITSLNEALTNLQDDLTNIDITGATNNTGSTIASGTFFYLNSVLVRAKIAISNGATFTLNTNYEVVTSGSLNQINTELREVDSLKYSDLASAISLNAYTTLENCYVALRDGYVCWQTNSGTVSGSVYASRVNNSTHFNFGSTVNNMLGAIYVKKGMRIIVPTITSNAGVQFFGLT